MRKPGLFGLLLAWAALATSAAAAPLTLKYGSPEFMRDVAYAPKPVIPQKAWDMNWKGTTIYRLHVRRGTFDVDEIKILKSSGHPILDRAALPALIQWKFKPGAPEYVNLVMDCQY